MQILQQTLSYWWIPIRASNASTVFGRQTLCVSDNLARALFENSKKEKVGIQHVNGAS